MSDEQYELALKFIDDIHSAMNFFEVQNYRRLDNSPTPSNYGVVIRNGQPELVFIDFGHEPFIDEAIKLNELLNFLFE